MPFNSQEITKTIGHLAVRWDEADKAILRHIFPLLAEGRPVSANCLAQVTGKDIATVERALLFKNKRIGRDQQGQVIELFGITLEPTRNRIQVGQIALFSCCAMVAQMVPLLVNRPAMVESVDPISHQLVRLTVSPTGLQSVEPKGAVGIMVVTQEGEVQKDVGAAFCSHVCHFASSETAAEFVGADSRRYIVGIEDLHMAARQARAIIWG